MNPTATVVNALVRCQRSDSAASPVFSKVRPDLDIWVWELPTHSDTDSWTKEVTSLLRDQLPLLAKLSSGSTDYTLFLVVEGESPMSRVRFSHAFLEVIAEAGMSLEFGYEQQPPDDCPLPTEK
jgi:hypothetical protein